MGLVFRSGEIVKGGGTVTPNVEAQGRAACGASRWSASLDEAATRRISQC